VSGAGISVALAIATATSTGISSQGPQHARQPDDEEIVVTGRAERRIGTAQAASEGSISGDELRVRPLLRTSELAEAVPGLIAVQHSGGGKAAQYMIRGYNLDHGTDFSIAIDNMPFNLRSHSHGEGYLDLNGLIPETVSRISYRKGPLQQAVPFHLEPARCCWRPSSRPTTGAGSLRSNSGISEGSRSSRPKPR
jgi:outer membrane receptor protein involved in Fe transport